MLRDQFTAVDFIAMEHIRGRTLFETLRARALGVTEILRMAIQIADALEASKIAGHSDLEMTGQYTFVAPERQNELTRRIQQRQTAIGGESSRYRY